MIALRAEALLLNAALGVGIGLLVSWGTKKITEAAQRVQNVATKSKEAADAAQSTTSSLKDLVSAYEELGDKSGWDTEDFDQAKDIQAEILDLAKEQGTLDENKLSKLDLQNGKYEEQLGLLQDITAEQLEASRYELTQNKDAQGDKLVDTAKKNNRTHYLTVWSAPEMDMGDQIKNAGIDVFNKFGGYGPDDLNDADSIVDYYNEVGKALKYVIDNTTEAERAAGGTYHSLYQFLLDEQTALRDDVDSYNDSTDAINNNTNARRKLQAVDFWQNDNNNSMDVSFTFDKVNSAVQTLEDTIDGFDASKLNELLWGTNEGLSDEQAKALANLRKALTDMDFSADTNGVNAFIQALVQVGIVAQSSANGVDALAAGAQKMEDISSKMDEIQSAYKASTSAMEEYNQYGYMSLDSLQSLLTMNTEYLNCLELVNGKLQINKQSYAELLAAEYAEAAATILSNAQHEVANLTADDTAESTDDLKEKTEAEKTALENLLPALKNATAATATYSAAQEFANEVEKAGERGVDPAKLEEITNRTNTQLSLLYTNMNAALKGGQALTNQLNGFGSSSKNAGKSSSTTSKSVADLSSAFDTLTKAMKEYNQYGYISADTMKSLIGVDDKFTACLTEQNGKLELNTAKFRTFVRAQLEEANAANDGGKSAGEMKKILDWLNSSVDSETISFEQLTDAIKGYGTAMDEAKEKTDAIKSAFSGLYNIQQKIKNSQFGVGDLDATESKIESILQLSKFFGDNKDLMDNLVDKNGNINLNTEAFKKATLDELDKRIKAANETGGAAATALANSLSSDKANIESGKISVSDYLVGLGTDLERVNTELDKYQTNWSTLKDAMDEWNTTGQLTQDTMQKLQELPEEFSNLLTYDEDGNAKIDVKALRQSYVDKLSAFAKEFEGSPIGIQVQAMIDDVREPTHEEYVKLAKKTATYQKVLAQYTKKMSAIDSNKNLSEDEALKQKAEVQKELDDALEKALLEVQETDEQVTTKLKKHWDGVEKVIEEFKSALSDAKAVLSSFLSLLSTLNDKSNNDLKIWGDVVNKVIDKRIKALNKQKEALEENNEATERAIELSKAQDALARAQQQRTTRVYTENGYEWQANAEDVRTAREDLADKQREWNNKDAEKAIDDQIKKYNEFKDKLSEVMDDIGKSWKDYQKELEYTAQIQKMSLSQMEGSLDGYHNKIIASLNTGSAITGIQNLITNLESLINTLTKLNNLYSMFKTGEYKDLGTKGLWNTIKGFLNNGGEKAASSGTSYVNAAKQAVNAVKTTLVDTTTETGTALKNILTTANNNITKQVVSSGNGIMRRKYFRTYEDNGTTSYLPMMHGNKRHQRRQFQRYQEKYMASKYTGAACTSDDMTIRGYTPTNWTGVKPDGTFHIVPYADTYVSVRYGSNPVKVRGKRGQTYEIQCPIAAMNDTEVYVYNASIIQSIGDISGFYPGYVDFSHGVKLTDLKIGSAAEGYKNTNLTDFAVGNNTLLEHLNLQNVPNLKKSISLTGCTNLEEFYAGGSGITGVAFAKGGKIKKAELPAIASLSAKNLNYLTDLKVTDYKNITTLTVEKCPTIDLIGMLTKCTSLSRVRLTGVDWQLDDTSLLDRLLKMTGLDENGYNTDHSVIEGSVHVPIMRERQLAEFTAQWPDLNITYNTLVQQFKWTFVNKDGTVLDEQYIDKGDKAVDPVTRKENPIPTPTAESTISTDFTFSGWDTEFTTVFSNQTVTAIYTESVRKYTVRYMNRGAVLKETVAPYGSMVLYDGDTPTYTSEETAFKYYLFSGWDKGGYVTGDKDINAVYDSCEYSSTYFDGKEIGQLRPVEIYAMNKVGVEQNVATPKDEVSIKLGNDFSYEDIHIRPGRLIYSKGSASDALF